MNPDKGTNETDMEKLKEKIEETRARLDRLVEKRTALDDYYKVSRELDQLIEQYIELT